MIQEQPFSGQVDEDPYTHLTEFEQLCSCRSIFGMTQETLKCKLFPFSLLGRAKKWYAHSIGGVNGSWDKLRDNFCLAFFPLFWIADLRIEILTFKQRETETLGAAWATVEKLGEELAAVRCPRRRFGRDWRMMDRFKPTQALLHNLSTLYFSKHIQPT